MSTRDIIDPNEIFYSNNYGPFKYIDDNAKIEGYNKRAVTIQFINTGTISTVPYRQAKEGRVKDVYYNKIANVACIGNATCYHPAYSLWRNMILRCYDKENKSYLQYGGKGVTVCNKWLCFEYFLEDLPYIDGYKYWEKNPKMYHLDKDLKQQNVEICNRIYSLNTCCFIYSHDNISLSNDNNKYIGCELLPSGKYRARARINGIRYELGTFEDVEVAANAYNNFMRAVLSNCKVLNDVPYMSPEDVIKHNLHCNILCKVIK